MTPRRKGCPTTYARGFLKDRVLLVDDDQEHCEALEKATPLRLGYDVEYTTVAAQALERVGRESFAAILTGPRDVPWDGLELCSRPHHQDASGRIPGHRRHRQRQHGRRRSRRCERALADFLIKPIDEKILTLERRARREAPSLSR